jgi:hypothetical protein
MMTADDVRLILKAYVEQYPTQVAAARAMGITTPWLSMVLNGVRRPSGRILDILGINRLPKHTKKRLDFTVKRPQ